MMWVEEWALRAACRSSEPDLLFVKGAEQNKAKQVCTTCPVRSECLAEALDNQIEWGVWGGMTERERRALLKRKPNASWRAVLETARQSGSPVTTAPELHAELQAELQD
ncbi:WhiB family transcriptional regulator [Nocardioides sp.]|uniref:WhiB family transcriptional regulator n=1 Tax=Nocardioides sp. TaxID=35761 RepID=UPI00263066B5|nr:WhiB family transcriptional regulator [Nocardioides sp.]